ncbi:unnamed protein product [Prunus brigantina]
MDIVCWNVRGAACTKFRANVMELIHTHRMDILFLCEPRISGQKAMNMVKSLGFSCFEVVDPVGFSGGLWLLWHGDRVKVEVLGTMDQAITACVSWPGQVPWMLTVIYAKPCNCKREKLWNQALLAKIGWRIHNNDQGLWVKMFNDKHLKGQSILNPSLPCRKDGSSTWKGIMYGAQLLRQGMSWRLGRGDNALFWKDH